MPDRTPRMLCPACGVVARVGGERCALCEAELNTLTASPLDEPASRDGSYWVAVRSHFQCRACGHLSPLNHLDTDGSVRCQRCGLDQAFAVGDWEEGLAHAHAVGDLAGPAPEGRHPHPRVSIVGANPFAAIGVSRNSAQHTQSGLTAADGVMQPRSLRVDARPGHPLCPGCRVPLEHHDDGGGTTAVRCPRCGEGATHALPPNAAELNDALRSVLADEHRTDRLWARAARAEPGGPIALGCPSCGANLPPPDGSRTTTCPFCRTVALVPDRLAGLHDGAAAEARTWWLRFSGPSPARAALETMAGDDDDEELETAIPDADAVPGSKAGRWLLAGVLPALIWLLIGVAVVFAWLRLV